MSCAQLINTAVSGGTCGRPGHDITQGGGEMTGSQCQDGYGNRDGSQWCADNVDGVCHRVIPPIDNRFGCCTGALNDFDSCGNSWCPSSLECVSVLGQYCAQPANVTSAVCQKFCDNVDNKQFCDGAMRQHCQAGSNAVSDPLCTCLASTIPVPSCIDALCMQTGYQTTDHVRQRKECSIVCGIFLHCGAGEGNCRIDDNVANLNCGGIHGADSVLEKITSRPMRLAVAVLVLLLVLFGGAFVLARR
jgi:hypothetical protein